MSRRVYVIKAMLVVCLVGVSGCQQGGAVGGGGGGGVGGGSSGSSDNDLDPTRTVTLGVNDEVWWTEVTLCGEDEMIPFEFVLGTGQATGQAQMVDSEGNNAPGISYEISAPADTDSFAMKTCGLRSEFRVEPDPSLDPDAIQAMLGTVQLTVTHLASMGDARNYEMVITLSVSGGTEKQTLVDEVVYCLADEFYYCWWETPYIDVCRNEGGGCSEAYRAGAEELRVTDVMFEAGQTYHVDLEVTGWISAINGQTDQGGQIAFDLTDIADPVIVFGI